MYWYHDIMHVFYLFIHTVFFSIISCCDDNSWGIIQCCYIPSQYISVSSFIIIINTTIIWWIWPAGRQLILNRRRDVKKDKQQKSSMTYCMRNMGWSIQSWMLKAWVITIWLHTWWWCNDEKNYDDKYDDYNINSDGG